MKKKKQDSRLLLGVGAGTVIILVIAIVIALLPRSAEQPQYEYNGVLNTYFDSIQQRSAEGVVSTRPQAYIAYLTREDGDYLNYTVYQNEWAQKINERMDGYESSCGNGIRISYKVAQAVDVGIHLESINTTLASWYGFPQGSVTSALLINGSYTVKGSKDSISYEIGDTLLLRISEEWFFSPDIGESWKQ